MRQKANDTKEHVIAEQEQMTAARTKQYEEAKHTGIRTEKKKTTRNQGKENKKIVFKASMSIVTKLPVSATKPSRGPCHTICHLLPTLVDSDVKCQYCRCRTTPTP